MVASHTNILRIVATIENTEQYARHLKYLSFLKHEFYLQKLHLPAAPEQYVYRTETAS